MKLTINQGASENFEKKIAGVFKRKPVSMRFTCHENDEIRVVGGAAPRKPSIRRRVVEVVRKFYAAVCAWLRPKPVVPVEVGVMCQSLPLHRVQRHRTQGARYVAETYRVSKRAQAQMPLGRSIYGLPRRGHC